MREDHRVVKPAKDDEQRRNHHLTGPVVDQAALYGMLRTVRDLGLPLVSVMEVEPRQANLPDVQS